MYPYITIAYKLLLMSVARQMSPAQVAKRLSMGERRLMGILDGGRSGASIRFFQRKLDLGFALHLLTI